MRIKVLVGSVFLLASLSSSVLGQSQTVPIVDLRVGGLLGGVRDGKWIEAGIAAESILNGPMDMNVFGFGGKERRTIPSARRAPVEDVCQDFYRIKLGFKERLGLALGVNASWKPMPRIPTKIDPKSATYTGAVGAFLKKKGLARSAIKITQGYRIDLNGDGVDEVLIAATYFRKGFTAGSSSGDYSFIMIRTTKGKATTDQLVDGNFFKKGVDFGAPNRYEISSIADLNGDGRMEIVVYSEYYEGAGTAAFEYVKGKPQLIKELSIGCGV